jgi:predicted SnoaL-like aldol condensation-catalyzing enzyme
MPRKSSHKTKAGNSSQRKKIIRDFFGLVMQGRQKEGLRFFAPNCKQHNPYTIGGMEALFEGMTAAQKNAPVSSAPSFTIRSLLAEGDLVAAHTELLASKSKPGEGGLRQVHLFRFDKRNKIVEYWDVSQMVRPDMPNAAGAF